MTVCVFFFAAGAERLDAERRGAEGAGGALAAPAAKRASARPAPKITAFELAAQMRDQLESLQQASRSRAEYTNVMDAFRSIYHNTPRDPRAPDSIYAVAQLLAEQGRIFGDARSLQAAVGQFDFLRQQYPTSSFRINALLFEGQIEQNDLHDAAAAKAKFNELLKIYPRSAQAEDARSALAAMNPAAQPAAAASAASAPPATAQPAPAQPVPSEAPARSASRLGGLAQVTSIRHWSTSAYTRVVVQLGEKVEYSSGRVANPDRIYFDLLQTRLARDLYGKSIEVTDNGYLRRIRVAQFSNDVTRVVLDVGGNADYTSFLLPDPYRLIIDVRSRAQAAAPLPTPTASDARLPAEATVNSAGAQPPPQVVAAKSPAAMAAAPAAGMTMQNTGYAQPPDAPITITTTDDAASPTGNSDAPVPVARSTSPDTSIDAPAPSRSQTSQQTRRARPTQLAGTPVAPAAHTAAQTTASVDVPAAPVTLPLPAPIVTAKKSKGGKNNKDAPADPVVDDAAPGHAADISAAGEHSLVRALGLKIGRIVIDAGHGGHDSGTLGPGGIEEKDVALDVALRLGNLLRERLGADVTFTRDDDTFIPLEERTAIANKAKADLFISIHANSSSEPNVRGVEVYYLNFTSQPDALEVAARENAVSNGSIYELSDLVKKITLKDKLDESREFAFDVNTALYAGLLKGNSGMKDRGVKKAPFMVLIGASMPSILAEIGFITNPKDAAQMRDPTYDQRIAEALYRGVAKYIGGLSGMRVAQSPAAAQPQAGK